jgi:hypothetical protein
MNARQLILLAGLAAVSVAAAAAVLRTGAANIASDRRGERVLPQLAAKANEITGLSIRQSAEPLSIERRDAGFVAADSGFPVKTEAVRDLLVGAIELIFEEARTSDPARYGDLGLADPGGTNSGKEIVVRTAGGVVANFLVGNRDATVGGPVGGMFVRLEGQPRTWLVRGNVRLPSRRADWFVAVELGVRRDDISKIELAGGGRDAVTATAGKPGELTLDNVPENRAADTAKLTRLTTLVESFTFQDVRKRTAPAADGRRMTVEIADGLRLMVTGVGEPSEGWVQISAQAGNDAGRAQANAIAAKVDGFDFRLSADQAEMLGWTPTELTNEQKS